MDVWAGNSRRLQKSVSVQTDFRQLVEDMIRKLPVEEVELQASGFGAIIRNGSGEVMASISARGPPVIDSEEAEILACRKALEFAVDAGFRDLIVEGDNKGVMTSITNTHTTSSACL